jgi:hypothetical protein
MATSGLPTRDIIDPKSPLHAERNMATTFYEGQVSPGVADFWQFDDSARIVIHDFAIHVRSSS